MSTFYRCDRCKREADVKSIPFPPFSESPLSREYWEQDWDGCQKEVCHQCLMNLHTWWKSARKEETSELERIG